MDFTIPGVQQFLDDDPNDHLEVCHQFQRSNLPPARLRARDPAEVAAVGNPSG
jgi:hypothetical protein